MSASTESEGYTMQRCASCGTAGGDEIKLKNCTACYLVRYCSVKCQKDHRPKHRKECKKRAAELEDEILFKQPESSNFGDCPICCLPLPLDPQKYILTSAANVFVMVATMPIKIERTREDLSKSVRFAEQLSPKQRKKTSNN